MEEIREKEKFLQEGMDGKRFCLCLLLQWKKMIVAAAAGALVAAAAYLLAMGLLNGETVYESLSNYYIYYNTDERGNIKDHFNAYTWNDFLKSDQMLDYVMPQLPDTVTRAQVEAAVRAECPSNASWMYVYVTDTDPERAEEIGEAYVQALSEFGQQELGFDGIDRWNKEAVRQVETEYRTGRAAALGGCLGFLILFFLLCLRYALDDGCYLPEDVNCRLGLGLLGMVWDGTPEKRAEKLLTYSLPEEETAILCLEEASRKALLKAAEGRKTVKIVLLSQLEEQTGKTAVGGMAADGGWILALPWGKSGGRLAKLTADRLRQQGVVWKGVVLTGADRRFIRWYYGRTGERSGRRDREKQRSEKETV